MSTDAVPTQVARNSIVEAWWFRFLVRAALAFFAFWMLSVAADRYTAFASGGFRFNHSVWNPTWNSVWLAWLGAAVAAGLLFGLATWLPFTKVRFLPSRLVLAAAALLPIAHYWWVIVRFGTVVLGVRLYWFDAASIQFVLAVVAGVAIASVFRAKGSHPAPGH